MHRGEKQDLGANFVVLGILIFDVAVRGQENKIDEHQTNGDHRAAAALRIFASQRNERGATR